MENFSSVDVVTYGVYLLCNIIMFIRYLFFIGDDHPASVESYAGHLFYCLILSVGSLTSWYMIRQLTDIIFSIPLV